MPEIDSLSRIGFGGYRVSVDCPEHHEALRRALACGCNLVDTSANYMSGNSERLIGAVLDQLQGSDVFVVTKGGYLHGENWDRCSGQVCDPAVAAEVMLLDDGVRYSIQPGILEVQLHLSLERIRRPQIDGYLLHNPEHLLGPDGKAMSQEEFYGRIRAAFEFLEEEACRGSIRYYGVSSNSMPRSTDEPATTKLPRLIELAREVSSSNHFKLVEFPFNLLERDAAKPHHAGRRMLEIAKENGLRTLSNRPLNVKDADGLLRLATYDDGEGPMPDPAGGHPVWSRCRKLLAGQLARRHFEGDVNDLEIVRYLEENWMRLPCDEVVTEVFQRVFFPLLVEAYGGEIGEEDMAEYTALYHLALAFSRRTMSDKARAMRTRLIQSGVVDETDERPLDVIACETCLQAGVDHVLVGMRRVDYVDRLRALFNGTGDASAARAGRYARV